MIEPPVLGSITEFIVVWYAFNIGLVAFIIWLRRAARRRSFMVVHL